MVQVTVIIPTKDRKIDIKNCLNALMLNNPDFLHQVIIIDDNSKIPLKFLDNAFNFKVKIIRNEKTLGAAICRNTASNYVESEIISFLDDDAIPPPDWIETIVSELNPLRGAITGRVLRFDKGVVSKSRQERYDQRYSTLDYLMPVDFFSGGNSAVWTKHFIDLGGFSKVGSGGDNSLVDLLKSKELFVHFIPHLTILHRNSKGLNTAMQEAYKSGKSYNEQIKIHEYLFEIFNYKKGGIGKTFSTAALNYFLNSIHLTGRLGKRG